MTETISNLKIKNRITAGLLAIFLGFFGVHNFYLGHKRRSIVQFCMTLSCPALFLLSVYLGFGLSHTTSKLNFLAGLGTPIFCLDILIAILVCIWWIVDVIRIFAKQAKDSYDQPLK